jgi:hypothetical protein
VLMPPRQDKPFFVKTDGARHARHRWCLDST